MTLSLPSSSNASFAARSEPSASPSGFSCVVSVKRSWPRIASTTAARSLAVVWGELIDQLGHSDPSLNRWIVFEGQLRRSLHPQLAGDSRLQHRVRGLESLERALTRPVRAEDRDEDAGVTKVIRRLDTRHGDEPDARILQLTHALGQHLPNGFVHAPH